MPLFKRGRIYYADLRALGGGIVSLRTDVHAAARIEYERLAIQAAKARDPSYRPPREDKLTAALSLVLSAAGKSGEKGGHYDLRCSHLDRLMGGEILQGLTSAKVEDYIAKRRGEEASDSTIRKEVVVLLRAMKLAARAGWWTGSIEAIRPTWKPSIRARERVLTPAEVRLLLPQLLPHRQHWLLVALYTGCRRKELEGLDWKGVDLKAGLLYTPGSKTGKSQRYLPIAPGLRALLMGTAEADRHGPLVQVWGKAWRDLDAARQRAGIAEAFNLLDLRRSCATWLADEGASATQVAQILGHTTTRMAEAVYVRHAAQALAPQVANLPLMTVQAPVPVYGRVGSHGSKKPRPKV